ncbi:MAG: hypothetical protein Q4C12_07365 [Clostridia bacterium]|nr:hypothetical protein [Clostridia bacterium]
MKKNVYLTPQIEIETFETTDIITMSGTTPAPALMTADKSLGNAEWNAEWENKLR